MASLSTSSQVQLTPEALVDLQIPNSLDIAASGDKVVYTTKPSGKAGEHKVSTIHLAELGKEHSSRPLTSGLSNDTSPLLSPDGSTIAFISDRAKAGESSAIYLLSVSGPGEPHPITATSNKRSVDQIQWSPCGKFIAYTSADEKSSEKEKQEKDKEDWKVYGQEEEFARLRLVHVATKEVRTLESRDLDVRNLVWVEDGNSLVYVTAKTTDLNSGGYHGLDFYRADTKTGKTIRLCTFPNFNVPALVSRGNEIFFLGGRTAKSICTSSMVSKMSLTEDSSATWVRHAFGEDRCAFDIKKAGHTILVLVQHGLQTEIHNLDTGSIIHESDVDIEDLATASGSSDPVLTIIKSSVNAPPQVYSQSSGSTRLIQLSNHNSTLLSQPIGTSTPIITTASDETVCDGVLYLPIKSSKPDSNNKPHPLITIIHGGPYYRSTQCFDSTNQGWIPYLISAGYAVLTPNYRGGSGHGEEYASAARSGMGTVEYSDVITLVRHVIKEHNDTIDGSRVAVGGWSQGGFLSYLSAVRATIATSSQPTEKEHEYFPFRAAICGAGFTDSDMLTMTSDATLFEAELAGSAPWECHKNDMTGRKGSAIWEMKQAAELAGAVCTTTRPTQSHDTTTPPPQTTTIEKEKQTGTMTPVLILHGENDERVPLTQAMAFRRGAMAYGWPVEMVVYPREPHFVGERAHMIDMMRRARRFCDSHL